MHDYDLNVILDPNLNETQLKAEKDALVQQIERVKGEIVELDEWGNRRLAYPIRKLSDGYYLIYRLKLEESAPRTLTHNLRLRDNVMRVLVTRDRPEQHTRKEGGRSERSTRPSRAEAPAASQSEGTENKEPQAASA